MKLTQFSQSGGCASKLGPRELAEALTSISVKQPPEVLIGFDRSDDAAIYQITPELLLVQTIDYFTPIVDDPYSYGQIAAANALSDVYAMGGTPRTALSVVCFPPQNLDFSILATILQGGQDKLREAGVALLGGHSVKDAEIKFGYAVTGTVERASIKENRGACAGDRILLTKPLGTGLITTALRKGDAAPQHVEAAVATMTTLNRDAARLALRCNAHTMTDVTGFGLVGHASEVARASQLTIHIDHTRLPLLPGALEYAERGYCSRGLFSNREYYSANARFAGVPADYVPILFDPQTSGGLLIFCHPNAADELRTALDDQGIVAADIGSAVPLQGSIFVEIN